MPDQTLPLELANLIEAELRNYRTAVADGDLDPAECGPPTLSTLLDSLSQAPADIIISWTGLTGDDEDLGYYLSDVYLDLAVAMRSHGVDTPLTTLL